jgi:predicted ester cyclase
MGIEANKKTLKRYIEEVLNKGDYTHVYEMVTEDFIGQQTGGDILSGIEAHQKQYDNARKSFPDMNIKIERMISEWDTVVVLCTATFTFTGEDYLGYSVSGNKVNYPIVGIYDFKDGKIVSGKVVADNLLTNQQLGFYPLLLNGK